MTKCCAYGIPNDPEGSIVRFTLCADDEAACPQFAAWQSLGSWTVSQCEDCKPPEVVPSLKCCGYGIPNDPEGDIVRFTLCTTEGQACPKFAAYKSMGSWSVNECEDCAPPVSRPTPMASRLREIVELLDLIAASPRILDKLREIGIIAGQPPKPKTATRRKKK